MHRTFESSVSYRISDMSSFEERSGTTENTPNSGLSVSEGKGEEVEEEEKKKKEKKKKKKKKKEEKKKKE